MKSRDDAKVFLRCVDPRRDEPWWPVGMVQVLGIAQDYSGSDLLTFLCPHCGEKHESLVTRAR